MGKLNQFLFIKVSWATNSRWLISFLNFQPVSYAIFFLSEYPCYTHGQNSCLTKLPNFMSVLDSKGYFATSTILLKSCALIEVYGLDWQLV